ncbi:MAG: alpha/beta hydrolase-fold protein [Candidatus Korobacteraceae bacterium]|jgi:S-formylglutathione hydrolase FrmB
MKHPSRFARLACLFFALAFAPLLHAQGRAECFVIKSQILGRPVRYCAFLPASFDQDKTRRYPVLYFLHGLEDNEESLLNFGGWDVVSELRSKGKIGDFVILAPSAGHTFYINSENGKVRYEDFLMKEFMPEMEKRYRAAGTRATRGITGISMGGYGALRLAFRYPDEFAAVSAQMPALITNVPKDLGASAQGGPGALLGDVFGSRDYFDRNNVFYFARTESAASLKRMKIYFDVGSNDDYGFEQGAQELDKLLRSRGIPHEFHIYPGGHTAQFVISHFSDVVQFQWIAIGAGK